MSIGIGGRARLVSQDNITAIYEYAPYNLNENGYRNIDIEYDGVIIISKESLVEPEIHEKTRKSPSGKKKLVIKRIQRDVDYTKRLEQKQIIVENSKYCWHILDNGVGKIAMHIIFEIYRLYQDTGLLPETISYHV